MEHTEGKELRACSATCMVCGGGEGRRKRKERMRRAGEKKGADAARVSKREHGGAVRTMEWLWETPDGGDRWRDDGRERRRRGAYTSAKTHAADHFWALLWKVVGVPRRQL